MEALDFPAKPASPARSRFAFSLSHSDQSLLRASLDAEETTYDSAARMVRTPFSSPGYHTTLRGGMVHPTRQSLVYAVALLDSGEAARLARAADIFDAVLSQQDCDPSSKTYGVWPWFLEEPLSQMAPPDWNWADFCGAQLLEALLTHEHRLQEPLCQRMKDAVVHAARSIERRNVGPDYTNISIMGAFVTLAAAEAFGISDLHAYALQRLRRFHAHTLWHGAFNEYNSPNYTVVALNELLRLCRYARDPEAREMACALYRLAWEEIAIHFHAPSAQWSGPHSRSYQTFLPNGVQFLLHRATQGRFPAEACTPAIIEECQRMPHECPPDLAGMFLETPSAPLEIHRVFQKGAPDFVGSTYSTPDFTLGSINVGEMWNQRRPLLAYWGTASAPASFRVRCLRNGYDFSAAQFFSVQNHGRLLAGISFATDGGNTHICLDPIRDGRIRIADLRLRFEWEGPDLPRIEIAPSSLKEPVALNFKTIGIGLTIAFARWGDIDAHWEAGHAGACSWLDLVLFSGAETEFQLTDLALAAVAFGLEIKAGSARLPAVRACLKGNQLSLSGNDLHLDFRSGPSTIQDLRSSFCRRSENTTA